MNQSNQVEKVVTINKSAEELYHFWHDFENLPRFMKHLKEVKVYDNRRSHWVSRGPLDSSIEWDAVIIEDRENELISWSAVQGADVDNSGSVRFQPAPGDRGTEVKVVIQYHPPGGAIGDAVAQLFGEKPEQQLGDDLHRFKMIAEAGEIATTEGQPKGSG
jgi:uncharacterized membrane protein